ncbi:hypothetical protein BFF78_41785 [Streptomyces fodineus]|uniref:Uncharacterized protein n=1 Tax=Streptomyces fodineus TaxID=1904616 RepID=A0A1D7YME2_9ACTN|nr:hypothetical protein [Streptomyces fodineus]AOR36721.1 hypothetical protein BFF78_41785 [Streptomyces fodineus]
MGALLWLLFPLFAGVTASAWARYTGRRRPSPPDRNTWEDLDRYQQLRTVLSASEHCGATVAPGAIGRYLP